MDQQPVAEKKPQRKKMVKFSVRLPEVLATSLKIEADGLQLSVSDVLRLKLSDKDRAITVKKVQKSHREYTPVDPDLLRQIAIIGNNLNQIARALNKSNATGSTIDLIANLSVLTAIDQELNKFLSNNGQI